MKTVTLKVTHYGYPDDPTPDKYTKRGIGSFGWLRSDSCALTVQASSQLGCSPHAKLIVKWPDGYQEERYFDDRAPEAESRLDCYRTNINNKTATNWPHGEMAEVTYVPIPDD